MASNEVLANDPKKTVAVLVAAVMVALFVVGGLVLYSDHARRPLLEDVLLEPALLSQLNIEDVGPDGKPINYIFDRIELSLFHQQAQKWIQVPLLETDYQTIYKAIRRDRALPDEDGTIERIFHLNDMITLTIWVRSEERDEALQQVVFAASPEGFYRVEIRQQDREWVYFSHPKIYDQLVDMIEGRS